MRVLLIGLGNMGSKYLRKLKGMGISPVLCDRDPSKRERFREYLFYQDFRNAREGVSRVIVAVNPKEHVSIAKEFLKAGVPVLLEKPPAVSSSDFEEVWKDPNLEVSEIELYSYPVKMFPRNIPVREVEIDRFGRGRGYIDPFWDLAWHDLYILQYLFGGVEVFSVNRGRLWEMEGCARSIPFRIRVAWEYGGEPVRRWVLHTETGTVVMDLLRERLEMNGRTLRREGGDKLEEMITDFLRGVRREGSSERAMNNIRILESLS